MSKLKTSYFCENCNYESIKWIGNCPSCKNWNSFSLKELTKENKSKKKDLLAEGCRPISLSKVKFYDFNFHTTGFKEFDRVLGGGLILGSICLIGGSPGVGKSTLLSKTIANFCRLNSSYAGVYISGEESNSQVANRFSRLGENLNNLFLLHQSSWQSIKARLDELRPSIIVLDSIQTIYSEEINSPAGSVSQTREVTLEIINYVKAKLISTFIVGHITKDGSLAGPKILEHMVDTVVYFESGGKDEYRVVRTVKNRFGSTDDVGLFEMASTGLKDLEDPQKIFKESKLDDKYGNAISVNLEGSRCLISVIQALVIENRNGNGRRVAVGIELGRFSMLVAILEKYLSISLNFNDIFINVIGGTGKIGKDNDLAVIAAIYSSLMKKPLLNDFVFLGEVGLTGEVRNVTQFEKKVNDLGKLGVQGVYCSPGANSLEIDFLKINQIDHIKQLKRICE